MSARLSDTRPEAAAVHAALIRDAGLPRRAGMTRALTDRVRRIAWQRIRREHPDEGERDVALRFAALVYGQEIAQKIRESLGRRAA